jgi:hypothetical protein
MQEERRSFLEVTANLDTKSDKIRALARAGYLRTEIAELLCSYRRNQTDPIGNS